MSRENETLDNLTKELLDTFVGLTKTLAEIINEQDRHIRVLQKSVDEYEYQAMTELHKELDIPRYEPTDDELEEMCEALEKNKEKDNEQDNELHNVIRRGRPRKNTLSERQKKSRDSN